MALPTRIVVIVTLSALVTCGQALAGLEGQSLLLIFAQPGPDGDRPLRGTISGVSCCAIPPRASSENSNEAPDYNSGFLIAI